MFPPAPIYITVSGNTIWVSQDSNGTQVIQFGEFGWDGNDWMPVSVTSGGVMQVAVVSGTSNGQGIGWNQQVAVASGTFAASAAAGSIINVPIPLPQTPQKDALYLVSFMNPSALGTALTATFQNQLNFGGSGTHYATVTQITIPSGGTQSYLIQGWPMGDAAAQIQLSNQSAASSTGGTVLIEVTKV